MRKKVKLAVLALSTNVLGGGTIALAEYDTATNTDTLTNQMVSSTRGDVNRGDFKSYDYPDRNLVIKWTDNSRGDGAAIRDAEVKAKNISIDTNFSGNKWTDKGIISDVATHITATGDINIISYDDAVYTQSAGTTTIEGFKNLNIKVTGQGYGLVDNGRGITVKGGEGSSIFIDNTGSFFNFRGAISNLGTSYVGDGMTVEAGKITVKSKNPSVNAIANKTEIQL